MKEWGYRERANLLAWLLENDLEHEARKLNETIRKKYASYNAHTDEISVSFALGSESCFKTKPAHECLDYISSFEGWDMNPKELRLED